MLLLRLYALIAALVALPFSMADDDARTANVYIYRDLKCEMPMYAAGCADLPPQVCCSALEQTNWASARITRRLSKHRLLKLRDHYVGVAHSADDTPGSCGPVCDLDESCVKCARNGISGVSWGPRQRHHHGESDPAPYFDEKRDVNAVGYRCATSVPVNFVVVDGQHYNINASVPVNVTEHLTEAVRREYREEQLHESTRAFLFEPTLFSEEQIEIV